MDTTKFELILSELTKLSNQVVKMDIEKTWLETYGGTLVGLLAVLVSLYLGLMQVKATAKNTLRINLLNELKILLLKYNSEFEKTMTSLNLEGKSTNYKNQIKILESITLEFKILLENKRISHRNFLVQLELANAIFNNKKLETIKQEWLKIKKILLNRLDTVFEFEKNRI